MKKVLRVVFVILIIVFFFSLIGLFFTQRIEKKIMLNQNNCYLETKVQGWHAYLFSSGGLGNFPVFVQKGKEPITALILLNIFQNRLQRMYSNLEHNGMIEDIHFFLILKMRVVGNLRIMRKAKETVFLLSKIGKEKEDKVMYEVLSNPEKMISHAKKYVEKHPKDKSGIITLSIAKVLNGEKITLTSDLLKIKEHNLNLLNFLLMNGFEEPVLEYLKTHSDYKSDYPLILSAVIGNSEKTFDLLIKKDWNTTDQNGLTWFDYAIIFNRNNLIEKYRDYVLKLKDTKDKFGNTPIFYAIDCGKTEIAKWLVDNGISPLETNCYNKTAIQEAMIYGEIHFLSYLIEKGYKITQKDLDTTIYYQYSLLNFPELLEFYRKLGLKVKDKFIVLGYKFAESNNNKETAEKLRKEPAVRQYLLKKGKDENKNE